MKNRTKLALVFSLVPLVSLGAEDTRFFRISGPVASTIQSYLADGFIRWTNAPTNAIFIIQTARSLAVSANWVDYVQVPAAGAVTSHRITDPDPPVGMALIPGGIFAMGDAFDEGELDERPVHTVRVSAFYMDRYEVTKALWEEVYGWAITHGYGFDNPGSGKAADHPVHTVNWWDVVKWCNARSEKEGRVPAYYTSGAQVTVYRMGREVVLNDCVKWDRGYRLPTEAEWEKAARGGVSGKRFPWGDTISHGQANYYSSRTSAWDVSPTIDYHPNYATGDVLPYTSPVGSFGANGYGLYDMVGNVWERCWDYFASYTDEGVADPRGPSGATYRVHRGGAWNPSVPNCRLARRGYGREDANVNNACGFRTVLSPGL